MPVTGADPDSSGSLEYSNTSPVIGATFKLTPAFNLYANYGEGFETPTFTEMAYSANDGMNFNLLPASSDNYEWGVKAQNAWGNFTAAVFQSKTQNDIVSAGTIDGRATFKNADRTLREGAELSWNKTLWRDLSTQASYSYINAEFDGNTAGIQSGAKIPGIAKNQAFASLGWQPETGFNAGVDVRYMDKVYVDDANSDAAPSYTVASANAGYVWKQADWKVRTYVRADNLFDKTYVGSVIVNDGNGRFFEPADGLNWSAGLSVTKAF